MNYYLNPTWSSFFRSIWKVRNGKTFFFSLTFTLFLIFSNQKITAQIPINCVGSTSVQKYTGSMRTSDYLMEGENLTSANGQFHLRVTTQGELVIEEILESKTCGICNEKITMRAGREIWRAPSDGRLKSPPRMSTFNVNTDCNLCFVSKLNQQWCATNGNDANRNLLGKCDKLILTNDGRLVLINDFRQEIWSNRASQSSLTNIQNNNNQTNFSNNNKFHISNADLRNNKLNAHNDLDNLMGKGNNNQAKSNLKKGTYVCLNLSDGTLGRAMVVGEGLMYGPNRDSYAVKIVEGARRGQKYYLKPYQIDRVGDCTEIPNSSSSQDEPTSIDLNGLEQKILTEINIIRANPRAYANEIAQLKYAKFGNGNNPFYAIAIGNDLVMRCYNNGCQNDNSKKLQTIINHLRSLPPSLPLLKPNRKLAQAATLLAADRGSIRGHTDSQGRSPACRAESVGYPSSMVGECLDSGYTNAASFVFSLLNSSLHRNIILNADANEIGADVVRHSNERGEYIRSVIMTGNNNYADTPGSCR